MQAEVNCHERGEVADLVKIILCTYMSGCSGLRLRFDWSIIKGQPSNKNLLKKSVLDGDDQSFYLDINNESALYMSSLVFNVICVHLMHHKLRNVYAHDSKLV